MRVDDEWSARDCAWTRLGGRAATASLAWALAGCSATVARTDPAEGAVAVDAAVDPDVGRRLDVGAPSDARPPGDLGMGADCAPPARSLAGARCERDADCDPCGTTRLTCLRTLTTGGFCTAPCERGRPAAEEAACGGAGSACLIPSPSSPIAGAPGLCARACVPHIVWDGNTACGAGEVCTSFWFGRPSVIQATSGCFPFCTDDRQCEGLAATPHCNPRLGRCAATGVDPALLRDGEPCDPVEVLASGRPRCRGTCFALSATAPRQGLCGSYVNADRTESCPDDAAQMIAGASVDRLGLCLWRPCQGGPPCPPGLVCRRPEIDGGRGPRVVSAPLRCDYPTALQPTGNGP